MKGLKKAMVWGIVFVSVLGTLFHFVYTWSGSNPVVGLFTPVNESIWEHTKLIFFPMLLYSWYLDKEIRKEYPRLDSAMIFGALVGIASIIVLFYTYSGILGYHFPIADISIFYISVIIAFSLVYRATIFCKTERFPTILRMLQLAMICLYITFTLFPPSLPLFMSPETMPM